MKNNDSTLEARMQNMAKLYFAIGDTIDEMPDVIPRGVKELIKDKILGNEELKKLMDGIESHRPPRIFLIGRTGVGKSSLINALCGSYVAKVSDVESCTENANIYKCKDKERVLMEILDTRGIAESESIDPTISAEDMLIEQINEFSPDVAILMLNCTHRDDVDSDVEFLKKLAIEYKKVNKVELPIVVVINKCDEMAPSRYKKPEEYPQTKKDKIEDVVRYYKGIIVKNHLKIEDIIAVSSLIDWQTPDGTYVDVEEIGDLPQYDIENLQMAFDGRYNIDRLFDILEDSIQDFEAQMGLRMAARLIEVIKRLSKNLVTIFAGISAAAAMIPEPGYKFPFAAPQASSVSNMNNCILLILRAVLVLLIATLSGREISLDAATEFILSLAGVAGVSGVGYALLQLAEKAERPIKQLNKVLTVSYSAIAFGVTLLIGRAAFSYYIDGHDINSLRKKFEEKYGPKFKELTAQ